MKVNLKQEENRDFSATIMHERDVDAGPKAYVKAMVVISMWLGYEKETIVEAMKQYTDDTKF